MIYNILIAFLSELLKAVVFSIQQGFAIDLEGKKAYDKFEVATNLRKKTNLPKLNLVSYFEQILHGINMLFTRKLDGIGPVDNRPSTD